MRALGSSSASSNRLCSPHFCTRSLLGQKALTRDLMVLLGPTRPDKIEVEKALTRWAEISWFLDEAATSDVDRSNGAKHLTHLSRNRAGEVKLPKSWRLGSQAESPPDAS